MYQPPKRRARMVEPIDQLRVNLTHIAERDYHVERSAHLPRAAHRLEDVLLGVVGHRVSVAYWLRRQMAKRLAQTMRPDPP